MGNKHNTPENNLAFTSSIIFLKGLFHKLFFPKISFLFIYCYFRLIYNQPFFGHIIQPFFNWIFLNPISLILVSSMVFPQIELFQILFFLGYHFKKNTIFNFLIFYLHKHGYHSLSFKLSTSLTNIHLMWEIFLCTHFISFNGFIFKQKWKVGYQKN